MIDNFDLIEPLLDFSDPDYFYFVQLLQRKKDFQENSKVSGTSNNSRLIKAYYVKSKEHLDFIKPEIMELCKLFNARAGINLNKRSWEQTALQHLKLVTDNIINKNYDKVYKTYSSAAGKFSHDNDKKWIIDIDESGLLGREKCKNILYAIHDIEPIGSKHILTVPSKNGFHLITSAFNRQQFSKMGFREDIQTNNPTNIFIP